NGLRLSEIKTWRLGSNGQGENAVAFLRNLSELYGHFRIFGPKINDVFRGKGTIQVHMRLVVTIRCHKVTPV
ncbi:MAG: hypothetical protein OEV73_05920, partial [Desulfobulbaceae bacterium]|nr:hypothetical protein [Desulfobulbaceae bacterium]